MIHQGRRNLQDARRKQHEVKMGRNFDDLAAFLRGIPLSLVTDPGKAVAKAVTGDLGKAVPARVDKTRRKALVSPV